MAEKILEGYGEFSPGTGVCLGEIYMYTKEERSSELRQGVRLIDSKLSHVLEFGVYQGRTIRIIREMLGPEFKVFGFDSFEGLPEDWVNKEGKLVGHKRKDGGCCKSFFNLNGKVPVVKGVTFFKGWFSDTLKEYLQDGAPIGLVHIDCDLYSSAKEVLAGLNSLIVPNSILVFDEWLYDYNEENDDHEKRAFLEWSMEFNREYEELDPTRLASGYKGKVICQKLVRITK